MALAAFDGFASFDAPTNRKLDISPVLTAILLNDTATLGALGTGPNVMARDFKFGEDSLNAPVVLIANGGDVLGGDLAFTIADASKIRVGTLLMNQEATKKEVVEVTNIAGNVLTVVRNIDGGGAETMTDATELAIVGQPVQEGDETIQDISKDRTQDFNFTQIFKRTVKVSGTQEAEAANGQHPGVPSELKLQIARRTMELAVEFNRAALNGIRSASAGSDTVYRRMAGLRQFLTNGAAPNNDTVLAAISEAKINALYKLAWDKGGTPTTLIGNENQINAFADFNTNRFRMAPSDRVIGVFVQKYLTKFGAEISLILDRWARRDEVYLIDTSRTAIKMLNGRGLTTEPLAKIGDAMRWQLLMEATLQVDNKDEAHAIASELTV